jgi:hypothetical protein
MRHQTARTTALLSCTAATLFAGCGGDAARVQRDPKTVARCFERSQLTTSPARGPVAAEADIGAITVRFAGGNGATVLVEQTEEAARLTAQGNRLPVGVDQARVRQGGSVVVVYDEPPQPREEQAVARCTGVRR